MKVDLTRTDLINLVKSTIPHSNAMTDLRIRKCGEYTGGYKYIWKWHEEFDESITNEDLLYIYQECSIKDK